MTEKHVVEGEPPGSAGNPLGWRPRRSDTETRLRAARDEKRAAKQAAKASGTGRRLFRRPKRDSA